MPSTRQAGPVVKRDVVCGTPRCEFLVMIRRMTINTIRYAGRGLLPMFFLMLCGAAANAQTYPARAVRFVVAVAPGGAADIVARTVAGKLSEAWGQQVLVDNRPGANTIIGTEIVARSKPDGYTWLLAVQGSHGINPVTYARLPYDAVNDFEPVTQLTTYGYALVVHPSMPVKHVNDLVALAKKRPGELTYGTSGAGGSNHLAGELFRVMTGVKLTAVPYRGSAPAQVAFLSGELVMMFDTLITAIPHIRSGRIRTLGVTLAKRSASLPEVPTIAESGVAGYRFDAWQGIALPAGVAKDLPLKIHAEVTRVLALLEVKQVLVVQGANELVGSTPEQFAAHIRSEIQRFRKLVKDAEIRIQ